MIKAVLLQSFLLIISPVLLAQNNYWRQEFGATSTLTGGAAVASVRDNSAIYYNPGALGFIDSSSISANSDVYGFDFYNLKNGAGNGLNMKSFKTVIFPQIVAGALVIKKIPGLRISYGTLTRFSNNYKFDVNCSGYYAAIPALPGKEFYTAQAEYELSSLEQWAGMGLAYKINRFVSLGLSTFASYTDFEAHVSTAVTADGAADSVPYSTSVNDYNGAEFQQLNMIFKFGTAIDLGNLKLGLSISAPGFRLWSSGDIDKLLEGYNLNKNNPDTSNLFFRESSFVVTGNADHLTTHYFQPASVSMGGSYAWKRWCFHFTSEFFAGENDHLLMSEPGTQRIQPLSGYLKDSVNNFLTVHSSIRPVLNVGLGVEYQWRTNFTLLGGIRTDFNNREEFLPNNNNLGVPEFVVPEWNYIHFSAGGSYKKGAQLITAGFNYGIGVPVTLFQAVNLVEPQQATFLLGTPSKSTSNSVHFLAFVLGYTYYFKK